jgi:hypothetical protein
MCEYRQRFAPWLLLWTRLSSLLNSRSHWIAAEWRWGTPASFASIVSRNGAGRRFLPLAGSHDVWTQKGFGMASCEDEPPFLADPRERRRAVLR